MRRNQPSGCLIVAVVLLVGILAGGIYWGPRGLANLTNASMEETSVYPALDDRTSPEELAARRAQEQDHLHSYGWIDEEAGIVHIPIDQAMTLLLEDGLPTRPDSSDTETE